MPSDSPDATPSDAGVVPVALSAADTSAYTALDHGVIACPADLVWCRCDGPKAAEALNGLVTNDMLSLAVGAMGYAAALTAKGKVLTDLRVLRDAPTSYLLGMPPAGAPLWFAMARKYINPRLCTVTDVSAHVQAWWLAGASAAAVGAGVVAGVTDGVARACPVALTPERPGCLVVADGDAGAAVAATLASAAPMGSAALWEVLRVEAGWPAVGVDMTDETLAQEACLDRLGAISFAKGCYTGQETVARIHFRGHVNRHLFGLVLASAVPSGAPVVGDADAPLGEVRSGALSPGLGPIALAMLRREVAPGASVTVVTAAGPVSARVVTLPFVSERAG